MEVLALIPARSGSKGLKNKNIRLLNGKPLIEYSINAAKKSKLITRIIVSTDSKKIASIAKKNDIKVPFIRPSKLSGSNITNIEVLRHTLSFLEKEEYRPDVITVLQPTTPLRSSQIIDKSVKILLNSKSSSVLSVSPIKFHPYVSFSLNGKYLKPLRNDFQKFRQRQKRPILYYPTGSIFTFWQKTFEKYDSMLGPNILPMMTKETEIDIDNLQDLFFAEMIIKFWKKYSSKEKKRNKK